MDKKLTYKLELKTDDFKAAVQEATEGMKAEFEEASESLQEQVSKGLKNLLPDPSEFFSFEALKNNVSGAMGEVKTGVNSFFEDIHGADTISGMADAFAGLGNTGVKALTKLFNPYAKVIALGTAAFLGL